MGSSKYLLFGIVAILIGGCGSYLQSSLNVNGEKSAYNKILVVAKTKDEFARISFENQVETRLLEYGVNSVSSIEVNATRNLVDQMSPEKVEELRKNLVSQGFDGVIISNLISQEQYLEVVEGDVSGYPGYYGRFGRYYGYYPSMYWEPDRLETGVRYTFESNLYDLKKTSGNNLSWIGRFKVSNPNNIKNSIDKYAKELAEVLLQEAIKLE